MPGDTPAVLIDTHVHIHGCFPLAGFFDAAHANFERAARAQPGSLKSSHDGFIGVLMLTRPQAPTVSSAFRHGRTAKALGLGSGVYDTRRRLAP